MWATISSLITLLPELIDLFKKLWSWIEKQQTIAAKKALLGKFTSAVETARDTGDTSSLEEIFRSGNLK